MGLNLKDLTLELNYDRVPSKPVKVQGGCQGYHDEYNGDYDCGYHTKITCEECKYSGMGRKDPEAKRNQL